MVGKVVPATKAEREHQDIIKTYCGCLPCLLEGRFDIHATIQHVSEGRKRLGQDMVWGGCIWHHMAQPWPGCTEDYMLYQHGPSLMGHHRQFNETYGGERLLVEVQNYMVSLWRSQPWQPHCVPVEVAKKVRDFWGTLLADDSVRHGNG